MLDEPRLLVVDDEEAICEGCRRIFSRQGFRVEKSSDASEGLAMAAERDYSAILLDIKMPTMDGIQFLEQLRARQRNVPVILMTGYPSLPNAMSAVRLGAAGYVTKPFTPEEISQAVRRFVPGQATLTAVAPDASEAWAPPDDGLHFWHESWFGPADDGTVCAGCLVARSNLAGVQAIRMPGIGEVVYQGLPLAAVAVAAGRSVVVPAPISGVVVTVNERLAGEPGLLAADPCGAGWIATVSPTRRDEETLACSRRRVILFNPDSSAADAQRAKLTALGCQVCLVRCWDDLAAAMQDPGYRVLVMEPEPLGAEGPGLVAQINALSPAMKIVLAASPCCKLEAAYRARRIFYYAMEPFADNEIVDILDAAFRPQPQPAAPAHRRGPVENVASVSITNRHGSKVRLIAAPGLLARDEGLGSQIRHKLLDRLFPIETAAGEAKLQPTDILKAAAGYDRVVVLLAKDAGRIPGSLIHDTKTEFVSVSGEAAGKVTTLVIQPDPLSGSAAFDPRTVALLAEHIVNDMVAR